MYTLGKQMSNAPHKSKALTVPDPFFPEPFFAVDFLFFFFPVGMVELSVNYQPQKCAGR